jgi:uncharacterized protein (DUF1800 family)
LVSFDRLPDDVDQQIGRPGYVGVTARAAGGFQPLANIDDARQLWMFRMVHSQRPLQEKMALFWHNHFATAYSKVSGTVGATDANRMFMAKTGEVASGVIGQIELFRQYALGNFRDLLVAIAKDPAMLVWLDGRLNVRGRPQENFARELMELFTMGVGTFTEADVYAGARVFSGWNLARPGAATDGSQHYEFVYNAGQHDTAAKAFSFPIYPDGNRTIPGRTAADGMQDGIDLINALAGNRNTARYLATKLYRFFVSEFGAVNVTFVERVASVYLQSRYDMRAVMREVLLSPEFQDESAYFARYSWPVEYVVRALKDIGWSGFSVNDALTPLANMGQILYEPPDVAGWDAGQAWFSTGAMLARMNFAATLASNQRFNLTTAVRAADATRTPDALLSYFIEALVTAPLDTGVVSEWSAYLRATGAWTGSEAQLQAKAPGLVHLIAGSPEYQLV